MASSVSYRSVAPLTSPVSITAKSPVPTAVLDEAQARLNAGDRAGAYLTLYRALGNNQLLIQAQVTTYSGIWGSGALNGNALAKQSAGTERYNVTLDSFSVDIVQTTINAIRADLAKGGTGRISDDAFQDADRQAWADKDMKELFPGNIQFADFALGNHSVREGAAALFSQGTLNTVSISLKSMLFFASQLLPVPKPLAALGESTQIGKRPAEYENNPRYTVVGDDSTRFVTVFDNQTGFVEAFFDRHPNMGVIPVAQLPNQVPSSSTQTKRDAFYNYLGANGHPASRPGLRA